jgi:hypothetical protein
LDCIIKKSKRGIRISNPSRCPRLAALIFL